MRGHRLFEVLIAVSVIGMPHLARCDDAAAPADIPGEYVISVETPVTISSGGTSRMLLAMPDLSQLAGREVRLARLVLPPVSVDMPLAIEANAVARSWGDGVVDWDQPWVTPGGDVDPELRTVCTVSPGQDAPVVFDVTRFVAAVVGGDHDNYGLLLSTSGGEEGAGFDSQISSALAGMTSIDLVVVCEE